MRAISLEIMSAGIIVILLFAVGYAVLTNFEHIYDWGCEGQMPLHPDEYSRCARCSKVRQHKHMMHVRDEGWVCDKHLGLE